MLSTPSAGCDVLAEVPADPGRHIIVHSNVRATVVRDVPDPLIQHLHVFRAESFINPLADGLVRQHFIRINNRLLSLIHVSGL